MLLSPCLIMTSGRVSIIFGKEVNININAAAAKMQGSQRYDLSCKPRNETRQ